MMYLPFRLTAAPLRAIPQNPEWFIKDLGLKRALWIPIHRLGQRDYVVWILVSIPAYVHPWNLTAGILQENQAVSLQTRQTLKAIIMDVALSKLH